MSQLVVAQMARGYCRPNRITARLESKSEIRLKIVVDHIYCVAGQFHYQMTSVSRTLDVNI
jgi:hypothetical protein